MRFGVCASFREVASLPTIPFDYLEENVQRFLLPEKPQEDFEILLREARKLPLPIEAANAFFPADLALIGTKKHPVERARLERYVKTALQRADHAGIRVIVFGSGAARMRPVESEQDSALRQLADSLILWSRWAHEYGIQIVLEPLRYEETNMFNTVAESGTFIRYLRSEARLLVDLYHMASNKEDPATILPWSSLLAHVHVAELEGRRAPGVHGEDFRPTFAVLHQAGYDQRISIECRWQDFAAEVGPAIATLREQWTTSISKD